MPVIKPYLDSLNASIDNIDTCASLAAYRVEIETKLAQLTADMADQIVTLQAMSTPPTDLVSVINWVKSQIELSVKPMNTMIQEMQEITTALTEMLSKISTKAQSLGCDWEQP